MSLAQIDLSVSNDALPPKAVLVEKPALSQVPFQLDDLKGVLESVLHSTLSVPPLPSPHDVYDGGYDCSTIEGIRLRIANGAAGQTGLLKAWADAFIKCMVAKGNKPFQVAWYLSESTESLALVSKGEVDVALTYVPAAETQVIHVGNASERVYAFRDHFVLVGPKSNPAGLRDDDDILMMFNKIVYRGNADVVDPPKEGPPTRFLSRSDRSATNIKESLLFVTIGQLPWALTASEWYHRYRCFPREALQLAGTLSEYTLIDYGTWLDAPTSVTSLLTAFKIGSEDPDDLLLNPAHLLLGTKLPPKHENVCKEFMSWVMAPDGGQKVIETFSKNGQVLYTRPPQFERLPLCH